MSWDGVITNAGTQMLAAWTEGVRFNLDYAAAGAGTVKAAALLAQTALVDQKQTVSIITYKTVETGQKVKVQLTAAEEAYQLQQIGLWGSLDDGPSHMIALFQNAEPIPIPSIGENPNFVYTFFAGLMISNTKEFSVTVDGSAFVTENTLLEFLAEKQDKFTGRPGQVVGFDETGNPVAQEAPDTGVFSFNGRTGAVVPEKGDYTAADVGARPDTWTPTAADVGAVPTTRTVNGKALSADISLTAADVGALPSGGTAAAATKLATARTIDGVSFDGSAAITHYGTCSTAAATVEKVVSCTGLTLVTGARLLVNFTYANTVASPTLNVNGLGAKPIYYKNAVITADYYWEARAIVEFVYTGSYWRLVNADGGKSATTAKLATPRAIDGVSFDGSSAITHYGTCSTAAATAAKVVSLTGFSLVTGARVAVKFTYANGVSNPTLNVNGTGAKAIYYAGGKVGRSGIWGAGHVIEFVYDGTYWLMVNPSFEEGRDTTASGSNSHAEGYSGIATGSASHVEGGLITDQKANEAIGYAAHAEGASVTASGDQSHAEGQLTTASNINSHAEGYNTTASGSASHAEGGAFTGSDGSKASGYAAHAEGISTEASGSYSHAEGGSTIAAGSYSHAEGYCSQVTSDGVYGSHAEGYKTVASGDRGAHAEGRETTASGTQAHAEGYNTTASGVASHAEGYNTTADGDYSHVEGRFNIARGNYSHAEGYNTTASGVASHTEGYITTGNGDYSHAEGRSTTADGDYSHAEGRSTIASGNYSHAEGETTTASGYWAHAEGGSTIASGSYSHAGGACTIAAGDSQTAIGEYNKESSLHTVRFIIGKGTSDTARSNCFRVTTTGTYGVSAFNSTGADYAEMFEWADGNPNKQDRAGRFVTLEGEKIRLAGPRDDYIVGIVSGDPSVVGDVHDDQWQGMYLYDIFGRPLWEDVEVPDETREIEVPVTHIEDDEEMPTASLETKKETIIIRPAHTEHRQKLNPDYDNSQPYIPRSDRPEWDAVGMVGKLVAVDDGTCEANGWCTVGEGGIATHSVSRTKYRVMARLDETHIRVLIL